ncbi:MAG: hypothetical protein ACOC5T_04130 [Elusimicrobiota bacterium]
MSQEMKNRNIFLLTDNEGNDHLVKRDLAIETSTIPHDSPVPNTFGFIFLDSFALPQDSEFATFVDIMSGERFRASVNKLCLYASVE